MKKENSDGEFKHYHEERSERQYTTKCLYFGCCILQINNGCPLCGCRGLHEDIK